METIAFHSGELAQLKNLRLNCFLFPEYCLIQQPSHDGTKLSIFWPVDPYGYIQPFKQIQLVGGGIEAFEVVFELNHVPVGTRVPLQPDSLTRELTVKVVDFLLEARLDQWQKKGKLLQIDLNPDLPALNNLKLVLSGRHWKLIHLDRKADVFVFLDQPSDQTEVYRCWPEDIITKYLLVKNILHPEEIR